MNANKHVQRNQKQQHNLMARAVFFCRCRFVAQLFMHLWFEKYVNHKDIFYVPQFNFQIKINRLPEIFSLWIAQKPHQIVKYIKATILHATISVYKCYFLSIFHYLSRLHCQKKKSFLWFFFGHEINLLLTQKKNLMNFLCMEQIKCLTRHFFGKN